MSEREILTLDAEGGIGDNIQIIATKNGLSVSVEEPYAGDTETGIGRHCNVSLTHEHARQMRDFLLKRYPVDG